MSYMHIDNLYKARDILIFEEVYAMEKIHGSSAHIAWKDGKIHFFSGGEKQERFVALFDVPKLEERFKELGYPNVIIYGEVYGGKCQGMKETYGEELRFVAFEVKVDEAWLNVPNAEEVAKSFGLDFVHYRKIPANIAAIEAEILLDSVQAVKNGMGEGHMREGIVLRPLIEVKKNNGCRVIAKHKRPEFSETVHVKALDPAHLERLTQAQAIAEEWVTPMRLTHVLDQFPGAEIEKTGEIIKAMWEDVEREAKGEIEVTKDVQKAVGTRTAILFKMRLNQLFKECK